LPSFRLTMEHASRRQDSVEGARAIERVAEEVVFDDVRYAYDNSDGVSHLSFSLPRGTITGLFGPSGSGKSTTVALLAGLLRPQAGRILIDGTDLADILPAAWHRRIAVVMQDAPLFTGTVRENILMGRPDADEAAVVGAAKQAAVHDTILRLPQGYDTQIAERGQSLSGGQAQRIALARALVREPDLLILDEATNALDEVTQGLVLEVLHDFAGRGGIVLIVTHRPEVIRSINRVIDLGPAARGADAQPRRPAVASR
jgi:ABC-type multidrug transport system fused ATPase/permease subunit